MGHTWYLSVDMQLFIVAPFLVYLLYRFKNKVVPFIIVLIAYAIGWTIYLFIYYDFLGRWIDFK